MTDVVVVGAAIVQHGRVLAARRTRPAAAAGGWEFPGGKVEPGEDPTEAIVREIREELGCTVTVTGTLTGESTIKPGYVLRVLTATPAGDASPEPVPHEHDAIAWLGPEQLDSVAWLPADLPFLPELRALLLEGERLPGGNVGGAVRIGSTVRRTAGPWTPAVHALLDQLARRGLPYVPQVLGADALGREVLTYLPGQIVDVDHDLLSEGQLRSLARWTRRFHDAVAEFSHPGPWRFFDVTRPGPPVEPLLIGHNDLAPYNVCFHGDRLTGVFDWDLAGPTTATFELAHLAWTAVPLFRPIPASEAARRLQLLATEYDGPAARDVLAAVAPLKRLAAKQIRERLAAGDDSLAPLAAVGEPARTERALADLADRIPAIEKELS